MGIPLQHGVLPNNVYAKYRSYKNCGKLRGKLLDVLVLNNKNFDVEYVYGFVRWGGLQAKSMT